MTGESFGAFDQIAWSLTVIAVCHVIGTLFLLWNRWKRR